MRHDDSRYENTLATNLETFVIRVLDIPDVRELEARMQLLPNACSSSDQVMRDRLGRIADFLGFKMDPWGKIELPENLHRHAIDITDVEDFAGFWKGRGWDVTGPDGQMLRCMVDLMHAMACIELGLGGASRVKVEADLWKHKREAERKPDPARRKQDTAFLSLGQGRRRTMG